MSDSLLVILIMFFGAFVQGAAGFGSGLVAMPLLASVIGVRLATPLGALVFVVIQVPVLLRYRGALDWPAITRLSIMVIVGVPIGVIALKQVDARLVTTMLGVVVAGYGLYALLTPSLPTLKSGALAYPVGLIAGLLSGAYNTGGPPLIIYGDFSRWNRETFKGNLQVIFMVMTVVSVTSHLLAGNVTQEVWRYVPFAVLGLLAGVAIGMSLDRLINPSTFRTIVLVLLVILGLRLIIV